MSEGVVIIIGMNLLLENSIEIRIIKVSTGQSYGFWLEDCWNNFGIAFLNRYHSLACAFFPTF